MKFLWLIATTVVKISAFEVDCNICKTAKLVVMTKASFWNREVTVVNIFNCKNEIKSKRKCKDQVPSYKFHRVKFWIMIKHSGFKVLNAKYDMIQAIIWEQNPFNKHSPVLSCWWKKYSQKPLYWWYQKYSDSLLLASICFALKK